MRRVTPTRPRPRRAFTVDVVVPETTIDSGPIGSTSDPSPAFGFSASEAGATFACRIDQAPFASCSSPHATGSLSDGPHAFEVRATDAAGNTDLSAASRAFTVEPSQAPTPAATPPGNPPRGAGPRPGLDALARCVDRTRPRSSVSKRSVMTRRRINLSGRSTDRECSPEGRIIRTKRPLARVEVSVAIRVAKRCRYLTSSGALTAPRSCGKPLYLRARITGFDANKAKSAWRLTTKVKLPRGRYSAAVRAIDRDGNAEQAKRRSNRATFQAR